MSDAIQLGSGDRRTSKSLLRTIRSDKVTERLIDGDLVLYDPTQQRIHVLNASAAIVWRLCDGDHDQDDIVAYLTARWPEPGTDVSSDVAEVLRAFETEGLLNLM